MRVQIQRVYNRKVSLCMRVPGVVELINRFRPLESRAPIGHRVAPVGLPRVFGQSCAV